MSAQVITSPTAGSTTVVTPWKEYATHELRDAWDMNSRTDIGFFTWGIDNPASNMTGKKITTDAWGNSVFRGTPANADPSFFVLDPFFTSGSQLGKVGANYPINTSEYTTLLVKLKVQNEIKAGGFGALGGPPQMQVFWSRDSIFSIASDPANGRINGGQQTMVAATDAEVGIPFSPIFAGCSGFSAPCGSMEGARYVIHSIPLKDTDALAALGTGFARWKNVDDPSDDSSINWGANPTLTADSLRFDPAQIDGAATGLIEMDWMRLVAPGSGPAQTLSWSGGGTYDIVVSTDADCGVAGGTNAGNYAVLAYARTTGVQFFPESWPNGTYYVGLRDQFTSDSGDTVATRLVRSCSTGKYVVRDYPEFTFTSPNPLGSDDDFATVHLNNPWDFKTANDIDFSRNITSSGITTIVAERPDATDLGTVTVFRGISAVGGEATGGVGDPHSYLIRSDIRGLHKRIDSTRYRLFTTDIGINRERDINLGSHLRLVWHIAGETWNTTAAPGIPTVVADAENVSNDLVVRHMKVDATKNEDSLSTKYTLDRIQADMADRFKFPLETDAGPGASPSRTGWQNAAVQCAAAPSGCQTARIAPFDRVGIDNFRIDYVEFADPTEFYVTSVRLAAHEETTNTFNIAWTSVMPAVNPNAETSADWKVALYAVPIKPETSAGAGNASPMTPVTTNCAASGVGVVALTTTGTHPTLASGTFTWNSPTSGLTSGALYFVCVGLIAPGQSTPDVFNVSQWPVIYDPSASATLAPRLFLDRTELKMSAKHTGANNPPNLSSKTPAQTVNVTQVGGNSAVGWTVDVCQNYDPNSPPLCTNTLDYVQLSSTAGSGTGSFTVQLKDSSTLPQTTGDSILGVVLRVREVFPDSTSNSPQYIQVNIKIIPPTTVSAAPIGQVDTPAQNAAGLQGAIGVTGWAVDDIGLASVKIYRNCLSFEPQESCEDRLGVNTVEIGTAAFVPGARPDVEAAFSTFPQSNQAGWGYLLLTNMLPHIPNETGFGGQGALTLYVIATDIEGHQIMLGRSQLNQTPTSIALDNDSIAKPFGAIDTPDQGGTTSGSFANFGWALTPDDNTSGGDVGDVIIPTDGSSMTVFIDGVPTALVAYNQCRGSVGNPPPAGVFCDDDVANIFGNPVPLAAGTPRTSNPTKFRNLDAGRAAIGAFVINTTGYSNGLHSIAWSVTDSAGRTEGIGSRNFLVVNGVTDPFAADPELVVTMNPVGPDLGLPLRVLDPLERLSPVVPARVGPDLTTALVPAALSNGTARVTALEFERVEVALPRPMAGYSWDGYLVEHGRLVPLPTGSRLDIVAGRFTWQAVPGYIGDYELVFVRQLDTGRREVLPVTVTFVPRFDLFGPVQLGAIPFGTIQ